jgi:hypothetical protein
MFRITHRQFIRVVIRLLDRVLGRRRRWILHRGWGRITRSLRARLRSFWEGWCGTGEEFEFREKKARHEAGT